MFITTADTLEGYRITRQLGVVRGLEKWVQQQGVHSIAELVGQVGEAS